MTRRGGVLLEVLVAIAMFVGAAGVVLGVIREADARAGRAEDRRVAMDLARSAITRIEVEGFDAASVAGRASGLLPDAEGGLDGGNAGFDGWEISVESSRSQFDGLSTLLVEVFREGEAPAATLRALVPTSREGFDSGGFERELAGGDGSEEQAPDQSGDLRSRGSGRER